VVVLGRPRIISMELLLKLEFSFYYFFVIEEKVLCHVACCRCTKRFCRFVIEIQPNSERLI